jgi:hypothetical protein
MTDGQDAAAARVPWSGASRAVPAVPDLAFPGADASVPEVNLAELAAPVPGPSAVPGLAPATADPSPYPIQSLQAGGQRTELGLEEPVVAGHGGTGWPGSDGGGQPVEPQRAEPGAPGWPAVAPGVDGATQTDWRDAETEPRTASGRAEQDVTAGPPSDPGSGSAQQRPAGQRSWDVSARGHAESATELSDDEPFARVDARKLEAALLGLRHPVITVPLLLEAPGVAEARAERVKLLSQIDDYLLPRLRQSGAPILVALVGSTGAGKSTLLNSVVSKQVSATGIRRPTTNSPVLACHPDDMRWFAENVFLPTLPRVRQQGLAMPGRDGLLVLAASEGMPPGVALLDTPDIDSVVQAHRDFAHQFLDASDLWLFVTTARRYADAAVWEMLKDARDRGASLAVVLSRVPPAAASELAAHFEAMLDANGLHDVARFIVPETVVTDAQLPTEVAAPVRRWLADTASREDRRVAVLTQTMSGVLDTFRSRVPALADQVTEQLERRTELRTLVEAAYGSSLAELDEATRNGSLLNGEVLARWADFVGTGDLVRTLQVRRGRGSGKQKKHKMSARASALKDALQASMESLVTATADRAAELVVSSWQEQPAGAGLISELAAASSGRGGAATSEANFVATAMADLGLSRASAANGSDPAALARATAGLAAAATRAVSNWQEHVLHLVRGENVTKRSIARVVSFDEESLALVLTIGVLGYAASGVEISQGTSAVPQRLLSSLFGAGFLRDMGVRVRGDLRDRISLLFEDEARRFFTIIDSAGVPDETAATELLQAGYALEGAR